MIKLQEFLGQQIATGSFEDSEPMCRDIYIWKFLEYSRPRDGKHLCNN